MCCSGLVSWVSSQLMLVLSAPLAPVKAVISARCIGTSFVRGVFDPLSCGDTSPQQKYAEWIHVSSPLPPHPTPSHKQPLAPALFMTVIAAVIY